MMPNEALEPASFRLPSYILALMRKRATDNRRSLNSEMIVTLERALPENEKAETASTIPAE